MPLALLPSASLGASFFVSPTGSDSNPGTAESPWASLQHAADVVSAGDTVMIEDGEYDPFHITRSGRAGETITFQAVNRRQATVAGSESFNGREGSIHIEASYVIIDGLRVLPAGGSGYERGIRVSGASSSERRGVVIRHCLVRGAGSVGIGSSFVEGVVIEDNEVSDSGDSHGIYVANSSDNPTVRRNVLHDNYKAGVHFNGDASQGGDGVIRGALIEANIIYRNGRSASGAINMDGVSDSTIRNNLIYNNFGHGITNFREDAATGSQNNRILNNTLIMAPGSYHGLRFKSGSTGGYVRNNILIHLGDGDSLAVDDSSFSGLDTDYNIYTRFEDTDGTCCIDLETWRRRHPDLDQHSLTAPPLEELFVNPTTDPSAADYHLRPGSVAIDRGTTLSDVNEDLDGIPRPQGPAYDIGAYERATGESPPAEPENLHRTDTK